MNSKFGGFNCDHSVLVVVIELALGVSMEPNFQFQYELVLMIGALYIVHALRLVHLLLKAPGSENCWGKMSLCLKKDYLASILIVYTDFLRGCSLAGF